MKIIVGSVNPVKINAVREAFLKYYKDFLVEGIKVDSFVHRQPKNYETFEGAENRALELVKINNTEMLQADFFVGIEGGIMKHVDKWFAFGCMCIIDKKMNKSFGTSPHFQIPNEVAVRLLAGEELGEVMDEIMKMKNTKQNLGAIGFFTNGVINRTQLYVPGIIAALIPFNHPEMFFEENKI